MGGWIDDIVKVLHHSLHVALYCVLVVMPDGQSTAENLVRRE